jgi:hypothetical protein
MTGEMPNLFVVGAARAGTTTMYDVLRSHPAIYAPQVKEPHFFLFGEASGACRLFTFDGTRRIEAIRRAPYASPDRYRQLYGNAREQLYRLDASTLYWPHGHVPAAIHQVCASAKIIVMLRDPMARMNSHFLFNRFRAEEPLALQDALQAERSGEREDWWIGGYLKPSLYSGHLERYRAAFGDGNVHVVRFEDLLDDALPSLARLAAFLGIDNRFRMPTRPRNETVEFASPLARSLRIAARRARGRFPALGEWAPAGAFFRAFVRLAGRTPARPDFVWPDWVRDAVCADAERLCGSMAWSRSRWADTFPPAAATV